MNDDEGFSSLQSVLKWAEQTGKRLRFYGRTMIILAEALVAGVGEEIVALKHRETGEAEEFLILSQIAKVQTLQEMYHL
ncbi:hypothetical protein EU538_02285 [Candidatus Thorarchaeota archaeon]|jgi:mRNA degradation ribonuclease J1/J2|nr:MAG: hypothetical protein EU538_02285 [Candidatus Thorarchaeota archaeon]